VLRLFVAILALMPAAAFAEKETVVLLHGIGVSGWTMARLGSALTREGFHVVNLSYPSRTVPLETLARDWLPAQLAAHGTGPADTPRLHFVTHSMGGILLRTWLDEQRRAGTPFPANLSRVVMLAPPNAGSEAADRLGRVWLFRALLGPNLARLGTAPNHLPKSLGPWPAAAELGIITGNRSANPLASVWVPKPNDGPVSVANSHLTGELAHLVLPVSHTGILFRAATARAVNTFLRTGRFE
jgi:triacylglycerol lipase